MSRIVLFAQQKGGAGKTMLLTQIAVAEAQAGRSVAIVDLDPQRSASEWHEARVERLGGDGGVELFESVNWRASGDIRRAAKASDLTLIDSPGTAEVLRRVALRSADFCVVPCQPSGADVWACRQTLELLEKERMDHRVVLNRVPPRSNAADAAAAELAVMGAPVIDPGIGARSVFTEAFMKGLGVTELSKRSKASEEIRAVVATLRDVL